MKKLALVVTVLVAFGVGAVTGHLFTKRRSDFNRKKECAAEGRKWFDKKNASDILTAEQFAFNPELDTCVCSYQSTLSAGGKVLVSWWIYDVLSNKRLAYYAGMPELDAERGDKMAAGFLAQRDRYMGPMVPNISELQK